LSPKTFLNQISKGIKMNSMKKTALSILVAGSFVVTTNALASVLIDDFSVDSAFLVANSSSVTALGTSSVFSVNRNLSISENPAGLGGASAIVSGGELGISTGFQTGSDTTSSYSNLAGLDFTAPETTGSIFDAFVLELLTIDQGGVDISLTVDGVTATQSINAPGQVVFAYSGFSGVDFTSVNNVDLFVHNNVAVDATFDFFDARGSEPVAQVPAPGGLLLMGAGLLGFAAVRRTKKNS